MSAYGQIRFLYLPSVLILTLGIPAGAQTKTCDLRLEVVQKPEAGDTVERPIEKPEAAIMVNEKFAVTTLKNGSPFFSTVGEGIQMIRVAKSGYKTTHKRITVDCAVADRNGVISEIVFMWKGDPKQTVITGADEKVKNSDSDTVTSQSSEPVKRGLLNSAAFRLPNPIYPPAAQAARAGGNVIVKILIDDKGKVIAATAVTGHPLLRRAAEKAAFEARFHPTFVGGSAVSVEGTVTYNFVP